MADYKYDGTSTHGSYHLAANPDSFELQRSNNFEFEVKLSLDKNGNEVSNISAAYNQDNSLDTVRGEEVIRLSVNKSSVPHFSQEVITLKRGNSVIKAAGTPSFSDGTLVLNDFIGVDTKSYLLAWQGQSYNVNNDTVGRMSQYKKDCMLSEYTPDYKLVRYWDLKGCWISDLSEDDFNQEDGGKRQITAKIQYDKAIPHLPDEE